MYIKFALLLRLRIINILYSKKITFLCKVKLNFTTIHDLACLLLRISKLDWTSFNSELVQIRIVHRKKAARTRVVIKHLSSVLQLDALFVSRFLLSVRVSRLECFIESLLSSLKEKL